MTLFMRADQVEAAWRLLVATGLLSSDEVAAPIRSILRRQKNVTTLMAEVVGVDAHARVVFTSEGAVDYDYLVLATQVARR